MPGGGGAAFNFSTGEAEAGRGRWISVSSRLAWSTEQILGRAPKLHRETTSRKTKQKQKNPNLTVNSWIVLCVDLKFLSSEYNFNEDQGAPPKSPFGVNNHKIRV